MSLNGMFATAIRKAFPVWSESGKPFVHSTTRRGSWSWDFLCRNVQILDKLVLTIYQNNSCIRYSQTKKKAMHLGMNICL